MTEKTEIEKCADRITDYLMLGGNFNPELMDHQKVRMLLVDCREELNTLRARAEQAEAERDAANEAAIQIKDAHDLVCENLDAAQEEARRMREALEEAADALNQALVDIGHDIPEFTTSDAIDKAHRAALAALAGVPR